MGKEIILVDGQDVTDEIRNYEVTKSVSEVSRHRLIREEMVQRQQRFAKNGGVVMDGRDIGTFVFQMQKLKFFDCVC